MGILEPRSLKLRKAVPATYWVAVLSTFFVFISQSANASFWMTESFIRAHFSQILNTRNENKSLSELVNEAEKFIVPEDQKTMEFKAETAVGDPFSTTIKFSQRFKGLEIVGSKAKVHFNQNGDVHDVSKEETVVALDVAPQITLDQARQILTERYQNKVSFSEDPELKVLKDLNERPTLVYHFLTRTTPTHEGQEVYLNAHTGQVALEFDRATDMLLGNITIFDADTPDAQKYVDPKGYPTRINTSWYSKVIEDRKKSGRADRSALNAYYNTSRVYNYYRTRFNRKSFDDEDSRIQSVVHMGIKMNNAFWTSEFQIMGYGDGDGDHLIDLTNGLDVAAHEMTHGVTASTAKLVYAGEPGALNESYSDFFGKMVDYVDGNWDIGGKIISSKWKRRALRSMKSPEEFGQPGSNDSPLRTSTTGPCTKENDRCGVHKNSGIPNRAAALIVEAIGKQKAEQLYYNVLTQRLSAMSNFKDARTQTELACSQIFQSESPGTVSPECEAVKKAFDTVKM